MLCFHQNKKTVIATLGQHDPHLLKNGRLRTRSSAPIKATTKQIAPGSGCLSRRLMLCDRLIAKTDVLRQQIPKQRELDHHPLYLSFLHLMKRRIEYMAAQQDSRGEISRQDFSKEIEEAIST